MRTRADSERRPVALLLVRRLRSLREWPTGGGSAFSPFFFFFYFPPHTFFWELAQLWRLRNDAVYIHPLTDRTRSIGRRQQESKKRKKKTRSQGGKPRRLLRYRTDRQQQTPACLATRLRSRSSFWASTLLECRRTRRAPVAWTNNPRSFFIYFF